MKLNQEINENLSQESLTTKLKNFQAVLNLKDADQLKMK